MAGLNIEKKFVETERGKICYFISGYFPGRPTVILLHGLSSNHTTWERMMKKLSEHRLNCIAPDLRGHGYSDKSRRRSWYRLYSMKHDIDAIVRAENLESVHIVGYSWGGYIALDYGASADCVQSLVLISTGHRHPFAYLPLPFLSALARGALVILGYLLWWHGRSDYHYFNPEKAKGYWRSTFSGLATMPWSINFWMLSEVFAIDYRAHLKNIKAETFILSGKGDAFLHPDDREDMAQGIAKSRTALLDRGHYIAGQDQEAASEAILGFYSEIGII